MGHTYSGRNSYWRNADAPNLGPGAFGSSGLLVRGDLEFTGHYRIAGTVDELGEVGQYRVRLFDRVSARVIRETWSAVDGSYSFDGIANREYFLVAFDHGENPTNAAISDFVVPGVMP